MILVNQNFFFNLSKEYYFYLEHYRELVLLKKTNPDLKLSIRLGGKSSQYTRHLKTSKSAAKLVRSLNWYFYLFNSKNEFFLR